MGEAINTAAEQAPSAPTHEEHIFQVTAAGAEPVVNGINEEGSTSAPHEDTEMGGIS